MKRLAWALLPVICVSMPARAVDRTGLRPGGDAPIRAISNIRSTPAAAMPLNAVLSVRAGLADVVGAHAAIARNLITTLDGPDPEAARAQIESLSRGGVKTWAHLETRIETLRRQKAPDHELTALDALRDRMLLIAPLHDDAPVRLSRRLGYQVRLAHALADRLISLARSVETISDETLIIASARQSADLVARRRHYLNDPDDFLLEKTLEADARLQQAARQFESRRSQRQRHAVELSRVRTLQDLWRLGPTAAVKVSWRREAWHDDPFLTAMRRFQTIDPRGAYGPVWNANFLALLWTNHELLRPLRETPFVFPERLLDQAMAPRPSAPGLRIFETSLFSQGPRTFFIRLTIFTERQPLEARYDYIEGDHPRWSVHLKAVAP